MRPGVPTFLGTSQKNPQLIQGVVAGFETHTHCTGVEPATLFAPARGFRLMTRCQQGTLIDCPVCGGTRFVALFYKSGQRFVRCDDCTLVLINPQPAAAEARAGFV